MIERELPRSEWVPMLAKQIIRRHWNLGSCERCHGRAETCGALGWARDRIKAYRLTGNRSDRT